MTWSTWRRSSLRAYHIRRADPQKPIPITVYLSTRRRRLIPDEHQQRGEILVEGLTECVALLRAEFGRLKAFSAEGRPEIIVVPQSFEPLEQLSGSR